MLLSKHLTAAALALPVLLLGASGNEGGQQRSSKETLDQLLKDHGAFGLPLPPKDAKLARYTVKYPNKPAPSHHLGFLLKTGTRDGNLVAFIWEPYLQVYAPEVEALLIEPDLRGMKEVEIDSGEALLMALQCHVRGWAGHAEYLYGVSRRDRTYSDRVILLECAWGYNKHLLTQSGNDRRVLLERLQTLATLDSRFQTEECLYLLTHLDWSLVPSRAKPESIEALIDDLVESAGNLGSISSGVWETDAGYWRVASLGFEAVPLLIEHLDDWRLARGQFGGFNNFRPYHYRVCHLVSQIVEGLANESLGSWGARGDPAEKEKAMKWWQRARKVGEEKYLAYHVLFTGHSNAGTTWPNDHMLRLIQAKHPQRLPGVYLRILADHPRIQSWPVAEALVRSSLPAKVKLATLLQAAHHPDHDHHLPARMHIRAVLP